MEDKKFGFFVEEFKGQIIASVWEINEDGSKKGKYPVVAMGKKKVEAIMNFEKEYKEFLRSQKDQESIDE